MPTVLIVEDDVLIAEEYRLCVEEMGWDVLGPASNCKAALTLLELRAPSIGLLDMNLRRELVTSVAVALNVLGIPFIMASGCHDLVAVGGPVFLGAQNVGKPVSDQALARALREALEKFTLRVSASSA